MTNRPNPPSRTALALSEISRMLAEMSARQHERMSKEDIRAIVEEAVNDTIKASFGFDPAKDDQREKLQAAIRFAVATKEGYGRALWLILGAICTSAGAFIASKVFWWGLPPGGGR